MELLELIWNRLFFQEGLKKEDHIKVTRRRKGSLFSSYLPIEKLLNTSIDFFKPDNINIEERKMQRIYIIELFTIFLAFKNHIIYYSRKFARTKIYIGAPDSKKPGSSSYLSNSNKWFQPSLFISELNGHFVVILVLLQSWLRIPSRKTAQAF